MLFLEVRTHFTVTADALANGNFKYFPQQTMTLSDHELHARLTSRGKTNTVNRSYAVVNVVLDFLTWNLHFLEDNVRLVFGFLWNPRPRLFYPRVL